MCRHEFDLVKCVDDEGRERLCARDGDRLVDLQAAHVAKHGAPSPHLRDAVSFRLAASYGVDLATELLRAPPAHAIVA